MKFFFIYIILFFPSLIFSQTINLEWQENDVIWFGEDSVNVLSFTNAVYFDGSFLPYYHLSKELTVEEAENKNYNVSISPTSSSSVPDISNINTPYIESDYKIIANVSSSKKNYTLEIYILPLKIENGNISRLESFQINITTNSIIKTKSASTLKSSSYFADNSVLDTGKWIKVAVAETGVYKLTYDDLFNMGITPEEVSVFTSSPGVLSKTIDDYIDDLQEIAIYEQTGNDGLFNSGDYILFYGQAQDIWQYNKDDDEYEFSQHPFWNENYYFITSDVGDKKRISTVTSVSGTSTLTYTTYDDYDFIEPEETNFSEYSDDVCVSGDDWYSDYLYDGDSFSYTFSFDNIVETTSTLEMDLVARSIDYFNHFYNYVDDRLLGAVSLSTTSTSSTSMKAYETTKNYSFTPQSKDITVKTKFLCDESTAFGLVDYFSVYVKQYLKFNDNYLFFRNKPTSDNVVTYKLSDASSVNFVWNITDAFNISLMNTTTLNDTLSFNAQGNKFQEFVAINNASSFLSPTVIETVENQNIHGADVPNMVIVTTDDFKEIAEDIADIHDDLDVLTLTQDKIFNEFSGGKADVTAIRWMLKNFYDRSTDDNELKYLLLLGDGDINNKMYEEDCSIVMTYQSDESLNQSTTYVSDDYFGLLDDGEGSSIESSDKVDIGIGRIPITTVSEGEDVVKKIKTYLANKKRTIWKNRICFVADDGDNCVHINDANNLAEKVRNSHEGIAVKKVFLDAFKQQSESGGDYYPDAKELSDGYIEDGCIIWNYTGHGDPTKLSGEKIIYISDINDFENLSNLPLWVTASCDFCPYDDNDEISAGERVFICDNGGGIGLFTTTRLVYSTSNYAITNNFYTYALSIDPETNEKWRFGDIARMTKQTTSTGANKRKFTLIGDPALQLVYPDENYSVITDSINSVYIDKYDNAYTDTIKALSATTICGYIAKSDGSIDSSFTGTLYTTIYDKISEITTLANDDDSEETNFELWNSVIYSGSSTVTDGRFKFSFIVSKDIDYTVGNGRIEYYATGDDIETNGFYEDFLIGSLNEDYETNTEGPEVELYMNSTSFQDGDEVNTNPTLIAYLRDSSGINTASSSVGHNITIKLNNDATTTESISSSYAATNEDYTEGVVNYQLNDLDEGEHILTFKVWDTQNNSTTKDISFVVNDDATPDIAVLYCYPNPISLSSDTKQRFIAQCDSIDSSAEVMFYILNDKGKIEYKSSDCLYSSSNEVYFDWIPSSSNLLPGLYFYRLTINNGENIFSGKSKKLLLTP